MGFISCGGDDDPDVGGGNSALVGTWVRSQSGGATSWYIGIRLNGNGTASYTEWDSKESPEWPREAGRWIATDETLTVYESDEGEEYIMFSCQYTLSEDGKTLYLSGGRSYSGTYTKQ